MSLPANRPSVAEMRRAIAVGDDGQRLGLAWVPGVVLADVQISDPEGGVWMPAGHCSVRVWGGEGPAVLNAIQGSPFARGRSIALEVRKATRWARVRAWWRRTVEHRLDRLFMAWLDRPRGGKR